MKLSEKRRLAASATKAERASLTDIERMVLRWRYMLLMSVERTCEGMGLSRHRLTQVETHLFAKLALGDCVQGCLA